MRDLSPTLFRGNINGRNPGDGDHHPFFFAEKLEHAKRYTAPHAEPSAYVICGQKFLDLTEPDPRNPHHQQLVKHLLAHHDEWICRRSGEARDPWSYLETGDLYDYEGTGTGARWNSVFTIALDVMGFDAVRILDCTDGSQHQAVPVWVTPGANVRAASVGEQLVKRLETQDWDTTRRWLERDHGDILERVSRLTCVDEQYRLDQVHQVLPPENYRAMGVGSGMLTVWRALPSDKDIRPGDWIALKKSYAGAHVRQGANQDFTVKSLQRVLPSDIYWAGTDESEFFYMPAAWRRGEGSAQSYLQSLSADQVRMLCDGENAEITRHTDAIASIREHVLNAFDEDACGTYHGPAHWERVCQHGHAIARSMGVDPLIAHIFAWVHDSQREDDGYDLTHGPRAAQFIEDHRSDLFGFLSDAQVSLLSRACHLHSDGETQADPLIQSCWDADRLDLGRVEIEPKPKYLCTDYAKDRFVIASAMVFSENAMPTPSYARLEREIG